MQENRDAANYLKDSQRLINLSNRRSRYVFLSELQRINYSSIPLKDALVTLFHSRIQFQVENSPIAQAPGRWASLLESSNLLSTIQLERSRLIGEKIPSKKVAIVSYQNWNFVPAIEESIVRNGSVSYRIEADRDLGHDFPNSLLRVISQSLRLNYAARNRQECKFTWKTKFEELIHDADTIWIEWAHRSAVMVSRCELGTRKVIVRIHSYELSTPYAHLVNWANIDEIVVVSELVKRVVPIAIPGAAKVPIRVIPNVVDFSNTPSDELRKVEKIAMVGWSNVAKDISWALEVIRELRRLGTVSESSFTLSVFGSNPLADDNIRISADTVALIRKMEHDGDLIIRGWSDSVPEDLEEFGFILSSSIRESFHVGLFEGISAGCVPIIRDWPYWKPLADARLIFPNELIVDTPQEAADLIRTLASDSSAWNLLRTRYREWAKLAINSREIDEVLNEVMSW